MMIQTRTPRTERLIEQNDWPGLLRAVLNSKPMHALTMGPQADARRLIRATLNAAEAAGPAAIGLVLQMRTAPANSAVWRLDAISTRLLAMQCPDGLFETPSDHAVKNAVAGESSEPAVSSAHLAATAVAVAGLRAWQRSRQTAPARLAALRRAAEQPASEPCDAESGLHAAVAEAIERAGRALAAHQHPNGLLGSCPAATIITLQQLGEDPAFQRRIDYVELLTALKRYTSHGRRNPGQRETWTHAA